MLGSENSSNFSLCKDLKGTQYRKGDLYHQVRSQAVANDVDILSFDVLPAM